MHRISHWQKFFEAVQATICYEVVIRYDLIHLLQVYYWLLTLFFLGNQEPIFFSHLFLSGSISPTTFCPKIDSWKHPASYNLQCFERPACKCFGSLIFEMNNLKNIQPQKQNVYLTFPKKNRFTRGEKAQKFGLS